jgi:hypothetical protein
VTFHLSSFSRAFAYCLTSSSRLSGNEVSTLAHSTRPSTKKSPPAPMNTTGIVSSLDGSCCAPALTTPIAAATTPAAAMIVPARARRSPRIWDRRSSPLVTSSQPSFSLVRAPRAAVWDQPSSRSADLENVHPRQCHAPEVSIPVGNLDHKPRTTADQSRRSHQPRPNKAGRDAAERFKPRHTRRARQGDWRTGTDASVRPLSRARRACA